MSGDACWSCAGQWAPFCHGDPPTRDDDAPLGDLFTATGHPTPGPAGPCAPTWEDDGTRARCRPCGWVSIGPAPPPVTVALYDLHAAQRTGFLEGTHP